MKIYKLAWNKNNLPSLSDKQLLGIIMINTLFAVTQSNTSDSHLIIPSLIELRKRNVTDIGKKIMEKIDYALFDPQPQHVIWNKYTHEQKSTIRKNALEYLRSVMTQILENDTDAKDANHL